MKRISVLTAFLCCVLGANADEPLSAPAKAEKKPTGPAIASVSDAGYFSEDRQSPAHPQVFNPHQFAPYPVTPTPINRASMLQPAPIQGPNVQFQTQTQLPQAALDLRRSFFTAGGAASLINTPTRTSPSRRLAAQRLGIDLAIGAASKTRAATDTGSLLGRSPSMLGIEVQKRTPIVSDPRQRGSRVGTLAGSGSHWVPARLDLDTMLSKIDSRIISSVRSIKGPYSVQHGPGFQFFDVDLLDTPRYDTARSFGSTLTEYKFNGEQVYGRQQVWGGNQDTGFRVGYGHRTGNDYTTGAGTDIPASYNSRDWDVALGFDVTDKSFVEVSYLRLEQTNVEYPGQAFDMDFLVTDGVEIEYVELDQATHDRLELETWYNRTRFEGNAQGAGKRRQFPFLDDFLSAPGFPFIANTDVDSASLGYRLAVSWGDVESSLLTVGTDLRYIKQELNEISSGRAGFIIWTDANSPIPKSDTVDPGLFAEARTRNGPLSLKAGVRGDFVTNDIDDDPAKLAEVGTNPVPSSYQEIVGTDELDQSFSLWAAHVEAEYEVSPCVTLFSSGGYGERAPNLTELYAAQPFMFLLQNGLNTVTGDPLLEREKRWQVDAGLQWDNDRTRIRITGFHAWVHDYITFENVGEVFGPGGSVEQVQLRYVNTDLAVFTGAEFQFETSANEWLTPFATFRFIEGTDRARDGDFATEISSGAGDPTFRDPTKLRGANGSGITGRVEALPGIPPMQAILGLRLHEPVDNPQWGIEISARVANDQDRVAVSLRESATPGFTVWDLRAYANLTEDLLVIGGIENFTDRTFREHLDFRSQNGIQVLQPGINFYLSTELTY